MRQRRQAAGLRRARHVRDTKTGCQHRTACEMKSAGHQQRPTIGSCRQLCAVEPQILERVARLVLASIRSRGTVGVQQGGTCRQLPIAPIALSCRQGQRSPRIAPATKDPKGVHGVSVDGAEFSRVPRTAPRARSWSATSGHRAAA